MEEPLLQVSGENVNEDGEQNRLLEPLNEDEEGQNDENESDDPVYALATSATTPKFLRYLVTIIIILTHFNYAYGQIVTMWYLFFGVEFTGTFEAINVETKLVFDVLGIDNPLFVNESIIEPIDNFTYAFAIDRLWAAKNLENGKSGPRMASILLIFFSGIWPHLKLLLLHFYWHVPSRQSTRTSVLYWLSTLGKYSIADVFVVCALVAVCNLDIPLEPSSLLHRIEGELPKIVDIAESAVNETEAIHAICNELFHMRCGTFDFKCKLCSSAVSRLYENPSILESVFDSLVDGVKSSGEGLATLRVAGLSGIHVFCVAVMTSLSVGLLIEVLDHFAKSSHAKKRNKRSLRGGRMFNDRTESEMTVADAEGKWVTLYARSSEKVIGIKGYVALILAAVLAVTFTAIGIFIPSMVREVPGSIPALINETIDVSFREEYSLMSLTRVIGQHGGWDNFLMVIFGFFCLFGPLVRVSWALFQLVLPNNKRQQKKSLHVIDSLGVFCALDVLFLALGLVDLEMPPITNTIILPDNPFCNTLHRFGYPEKCLEIEFHTMQPAFLIVLLGWIFVLVVCLFLTKVEYNALDPYEDGDRGGPYCHESCPTCFWDSHKDKYGRDLD